MTPTTPAPRPLLLLCILLAGVLAGCAGRDRPEVAVGLVDVGGILVAPDKAVVAGRVVSDVGLAVPGARISVLGTDLFTDADERGAFLLVNVTAGPAELQATHTSYKAHVHRVTLPAGQRVEVNLTLLPLGSAGVELPHLHDHWGGKETYDLLDKEIDLTGSPMGSPYPDEYWLAYSIVYRGNGNATAWEVPIDETPHGGPALVLPGTARMDVTVSWDDAVTEGFGLCYNSANTDPVRCLQPQTSPASFSITVSPTMADVGHQAHSLWQLTLYTRPLTGNGGAPDVILGTAQVQVVLTRGEVLVDPPHPTFWSAGNEALVMDEELPGSAACCSLPPVFHPDGIVPPGTTRMRVEHSWTIDGAAGELPWEFRIAVRTASMDPYNTERGSWLQPSPTAGSMAEHRVVYEFDVEGADADGYYQRSSFWRFTYFQPRWGTDGHDIAGVPIRHHIVATAIRA